MKKALIGLGLSIIVVLGGGYALFRHTLSPVHAEGRAAQDSSPVPKVFRLKIAESGQGQEETIVRAQQGDMVTLVIASDLAGQLEIHGYNKGVSVPAHADVTLMFDAKQTGRFPIHLHPAQSVHMEIGVLEIEPR